MHDNINNVLFSEKDIENIVNTLAKTIEKYYNGNEFTCICLLSGAFIFAADLVRKIGLDFKIDFIKASSYGQATESSGEVRLFGASRIDVKDKKLLLVDDVCDTGTTLKYVKNYFTERGADEVRLAVMFDKPSRRAVDLRPDFYGVEVPDEFIVGYGLDYAGRYRNLPYIGILENR